MNTGYRPSNGVPVCICNFTMLFTECTSCEMELSRRQAGLKACHMREKMLGRGNKCFEKLKSLPTMFSGDGIHFQELRLL